MLPEKNLHDCMKRCTDMPYCSGFAYDGTRDGGPSFDGPYRCKFVRWGDVTGSLFKIYPAKLTWNYYVNNRAQGCEPGDVSILAPIDCPPANNHKTIREKIIEAGGINRVYEKGLFKKWGEATIKGAQRYDAQIEASDDAAKAAKDQMVKSFNKARANGQVKIENGKIIKAAP